jgi:hypothetical protein
MAHPKHHKREQHKTPKKNNLWPMLFVAAALAAWGLWAIVTWKPHSAAPSPCCQPTSAPTAAPVNENLNHILVASAWCDHQPIWQESPAKRHVVVSARPEVMIHSVEVYNAINHNLLAASVRLGAPSKADQTTLQLEGAFPEGMHDAPLVIEVQYIVKGTKFGTILHCTVEVTH